MCPVARFCIISSSVNITSRFSLNRRAALRATAYSLSKGVPVYEDGFARTKNIPEDATQTNIDGTVERSAIAGQDVGSYSYH